MITVKPIRARITLGDKPLDVFQKLNGDYVFAKYQVAESIEISHKRIAELRELKVAITLYLEGFRESEKVQYEGGTKPIDAICLEDVSKYWTLAATICNTQTFALIAASQSEALERRADAAFNIFRTEEERNQRFAIRKDGIFSRNFLTDVIDAYTKTREVSGNYRKCVYINVSDSINRKLFGCNSKKLENTTG